MKYKNINRVTKLVFILFVALISVMTNVVSVTAAPYYGIDSGYLVGTTDAPYLDEVLGTSREKLINELTRNEHLYKRTSFARNVSPYFTRTNTMAIGQRFNCTGFVATALERAGGNLNVISPNPGATLSISNLNKWSRYIVLNKKVKSYRFASVSALLKSGKAEKGDMIIMQPLDWSVGYKDAHTGFFWGDTPYQNKFWHITKVWGNAVTDIKGFVTNPVYYLVKLSPSRYSSGSTTIYAKDDLGNAIRPMNIQLLDKNKNVVRLALTDDYRYKYDIAGNRTSVWVDGNGLTKITGLPVGQYYIRQLNTVSGHVKRTTDRPLYIEKNKIKQAEIINQRRIGSTTIYAKDDLGTAIRPMNLQLLDKDKNAVKLSLTDNYRYKYDVSGNRTSVWVDANGLTKITDLPTGQYYLRQLNTINGHVKRSSDRPVYIELGKIKETEIINQRRVGSTAIYAKDDLGNAIRPMNLQLLDKDKKVVNLSLTDNYRYKYDPSGNRTSIWVDENGLTKITDLPTGQYYLRQLNTIKGYVRRTTDRPVYIELKTEKVAEIVNRAK